MKKSFNTTGTCVPHKHYMVDISNKLNQIMELVEQGNYFAINRPRQYGKTTTLFLLSNKLEEQGYTVIKTSFEGNNDIFTSREEFCKRIFSLFADSMQMKNPTLAQHLTKYQKNITDYQTLTKGIKDFVLEMKSRVVLLIDEVDKCSNNKIFLEFLSILRNKYLAHNAGEDITFHSVILAGVHDIKNLKLALRDDADSRFNSPWNVAIDFSVEMSFSVTEIASMLEDYQSTTGMNIDVQMLSDAIYNYTSGYPYLVSRICQMIDDRLDKEWSIQGVEEAVKMVSNEKSTLFDDVIKNIQNNPDIRKVVIYLLIEGEQLSYNPYLYEKELMYGILKKQGNRVVISNRIFEIAIYNYLADEYKRYHDESRYLSTNKGLLIHQGILDMEKVLLKFQQIMLEEYRAEDESFYERQLRLIFVAYLRPIINGRGFYFVEAQTRMNHRMDLVVTYGDKKYILELKLWKGESQEEKGQIQLASYLDSQGMGEGYLLILNSNKNREYTSKWIDVEGKRIFEVVV